MKNDGAVAVTVDIGDDFLELVDSQTFTYTVTPAMIAAESAFGAANRDNFYKAFNFFIPLAGFGAADKIAVPPGTDLMVVRQVLPYGEFDVGSNYTYDNRFYLAVYNWADVDSDGAVWTDKNSNGVVNFINDTAVTLADYGSELVWNDPRTELDRWEYGRFQYSRPVANTYEVTVQDRSGACTMACSLALRHVYTPAGPRSPRTSATRSISTRRRMSPG